MARAKLILICQSGGEFLTGDDGSLTYAGGDAQAVNVNRETLFNDLKLKLAEMCNLNYKTMSIKYFLPGNKRTLITLSNDKDLNRMLDFHKNSVTAELFVMGSEGFDRSVLSMYSSRHNGIKPAETVNCVAATTSPPNAKPVNLNVAPGGAIRATHTVTHTSKATETVMAVNATPSSSSRESFDSMTSSSSSGSDNSGADPRYTVSVRSKVGIDISDTPAATVKKRRRTASWKIGSNSPAIVADADDKGKKRSRKRKKTTTPGARHKKRKLEILPIEYDSDCVPHTTVSDDVSLEELVASWKDGITGVGQDFKSVQEFRDTLQKYAIAHRFVYKLKKNDSARASGRCVAEGCSWRIHASWVPSAQSFRIKKLNNSHTCDGESWKSAHPTKSWLVSIIKNRLRESPHHKPKEIANSISRDFGLELSYTQVWRGIEDAREQLQGSYKESYNQLPWLCEKIVETNPGSYAKLVINDEKVFQRFFVSFHASIQGFQNSCCPLLFLGATSLKSKYQEMLLTATAVDGDDRFFPVAFAIVDDDNNDAWRWFMEQLKSAIYTSGPITLVSDREKGLKDIVLEVFENAHHGYSMYHLIESFKRNLKGPFQGDGKGSLLGNFVAAAHAVRLDGYKSFTEQIKRVSPPVYDWIMEIEPEHWASSSFKGERFNQITDDSGESYSQLMEEVRELPIIQKIKALVNMIISLMSTRQTEASMWTGKLTPSKEEKLREEIGRAYGLKVLISSDTLFEVHDDLNHVVNLNNQDCSCLAWRSTGLPCRHAIAVFNRTGRSVYNFCSRYFTAENFRETYSKTINHVPTSGKPVEKEEGAPETALVLPPCPPPRSPPSQPRRQRARSPKPLKRVVNCTRCKEAGHNKKTCKADL